MNRPTLEVKEAALATYAAGASMKVTAEMHRVAESTVCNWVKRAGIGRTHSIARERAKARREADFALTGGRWVNVRGVQRWEAV